MAEKKVTRSTSSVQAKKVAVKTPVKKTVVKKVEPVKKKVKVQKKAEVKAAAPKKVKATLSVALFDQLGKEKGTVALPEAVFGGKINKPLMAQAVRVYLANQRMGAAVAKTRGEVDGSTRKIYRQKGTGRARHGGIRAPLFVGGGIAHGPKMKDYSLDLSQKMKRAAVMSALSAMAKEGQVKVIAGLNSIEPKTKLAAKAFEGMGLQGKKVLLVMPEYVEKVFRATRNIDRVMVTRAGMLNTYEVLNAGTLIVMQEALNVLEKLFSSVRKSQDKKESK